MSLRVLFLGPGGEEEAFGIPGYELTLGDDASGYPSFPSKDMPCVFICSSPLAFSKVKLGSYEFSAFTANS